MIDFRTRSIVGVDIGSNAVKVVEVRQGRGRPVVVNAGFREIDIRRRDGLPDREATVATLRDLLYENGIKAREAIALLQGPSVAFFRLHLPKLPAKELKRAVRWEAIKQSPFPLDEAIFTSQTLKEVTDRDGLPKTALLACAVKEPFALEQAALLKEAGLVPVGMRTAPSALWQLARHHPQVPPDRLTILLDLGAQVGTIAFFQGGELQFAREIATAGMAITEALTGAVVGEYGRIQFDGYQAEKLKRRYGIPEEDDGFLLEEGIPAGQLKAMIRPALERLVVEIQRSFSFFADHYGETPVGSVLLSGGTARLKNLTPFLTQRLGIRVEPLNPFAAVEVDPSLRREGLPEVAPRFAIPVGLALERTSRLDLLPSPLRFERRMNRVKVGGRALLFVLSLFVIMSYALERGRVASYQRLLQQHQETLLSLKPYLEVLQHLEEERARLLPQLQAYEALLKTAIPWPGLLKELSRLTPSAITLEELVPGQEGSLRLKGLSFAQGEAPEMVLARYLSELRGSPFFQAVELLTVIEQEGYTDRAVGFEVSLKVK